MIRCDPTPPFHRRIPYGKASLGIVIGFSLTILVALLYLLTWPDHVELKLLDMRHQKYPLVTNHPDVVVLVIDDNCIDQIGRWPWPRHILADMVHICRQAGVAQLAFDINMPEEQNIFLLQPGITDVSRYEPPPRLIGDVRPQKVDNDLEFTRAIQEAKNVTLPFYVKLIDSADSDRTTEEDRSDFIQVGKLIKENLDITFEQIFSIVYPGKTMDPMDPDCQYLRHAYIRQLINYYLDEVGKQIEDNPDITFEQAFHAIRPGKNIEYRDQHYQFLLQAYIRRLAIHSLSRFSFTRPDDEVAIPVVQMNNFTPPIPDFAKAINNNGFVSVIEDKDGHVRRIPLLGQFEGRFYKQFAFSAACRALNIRDDQFDLSHPDKICFNDNDLEIPLDKNGHLILAWADTWKDGRCIPITDVAQVWDLQRAYEQNLNQIRFVNDLEFFLSTVPEDLSSLDEKTRKLIEEKRSQFDSLEDKGVLLQANLGIQEQLDTAREHLHDVLNGKMVLVGSITTSVPDFFVTPLDKMTPGVMVHRNILNTILHRTFIHRPSRFVEFAIILILGFSMTAVSAVLRPLASGLVLAALIASAYVINFRIAFAHFHYWFAVATPLAAVLASFTAVTFYRQITEGRARRQITTRFKQYTSPAVVDQIVRSGSTVSFAGEKRQLTCFFSDLAGFTTVSERLGSQKTVAVLNIYLDRMTEVLDRYDATVNKFLGDGIFAFFNAPIEQVSHSRLACLAALDSQVELAKLVHDQQQIDAEFPPLSMRIGIGTGEVIVGDCGSHRRFDYTAIGDTVNLTSRLEGANKPFGSRIMICDNVYQKVQNEFAVRYLGKVRVVGKDIPVGIYELLARMEDLTEQQKSYSDLFKTAVELFQAARITDALDAFEQCLKIRPDDKAATFYLKTTQPLAGRPIPQSFDGAVELTSK